ncbi:MAG: sigma 54-interacting transcriptional regulator [Deltaproteobacteria bacterium]|nr:sigma 54-interacting transcriptional regulator [Deltaproteobacteria bacterium]
MSEDPSQPTISQPQRVARAASPSSGALFVVHPAELVRRVELGQSQRDLGRKTDDPWTDLADSAVSRRHLRITWDGRSRTHVVADLDSRNGSWLDGVRLGSARTPLHDGAVIRLGGVVAVYERASDDEDDETVAKAIPGVSAPMRRLRRQVALAAPDPSPVLVVGPTGAGKEHVVRTIHELSGRAGPFVAVNVTELSGQLAESQLFGHVRGAFTGASQAQPGLVRAAEGGTLLLDEIGELSLELQPKLLRMLQEREVRPVGGTAAEPFDVRIVAATNRDLASEVDAGRFRRDLYARLTLWELSVPPLTRRRADVPAWIARLHRRWCSERGRPIRPLRFDSEAMERLLLSEWPENLRGLDRLVHRLAAEADAGVIALDHVARHLDPPRTPRPTTGAAAKEPAGPRRAPPATAEELSAILDRFDGSIRATARYYGRDRRQVYRWMDALGVKR